MDDNCVNIILIILGSISAFGTAFLVWKACQKPKAKLSLDNGKEETVVVPYYLNTTSTLYYKMPCDNARDFMRYEELVRELRKKISEHNQLLLSFILSNIGDFQLEHYRAEIEFHGGIQSTSPTVNQLLRITGSYIEPANLEDVQFSRGKPQIIFSPVDNQPLNQGDYKKFSFRFTPQAEAQRVELFWRIIAKDFNDKGKFVISVQPQLLPFIEIKQVYKDTDIPEGAEKIEDLTPVINHLEELIKHFE